jgi:hypothetical protein
MKTTIYVVLAILVFNTAFIGNIQSQEKIPARDKAILLSGTQVKSTDDKLNGILIHFLPAKLPEPNKFESPESVIEGLVLLGKVYPEWGIYDKIPDMGGTLLAIGYGTQQKDMYYLLFRSGWWTEYGMRQFNFKLGAIYMIAESIQRKDDKVLTLRRLTALQQIVSQNEINLVNLVEKLKEVHSTSPALALEKGFPPEGSSSVAIPLMIKDGCLRPEWGLFRADNSEDGLGDLILEGKRDTKTGIIRYDNSQNVYSFLKTGIYESNGKGQLTLLSNFQ